MKRTIIECVVIASVVILIRAFIATPIIVHGSSMNPTLENGEYMLLNKINYRFNDIKREDIVVFEYEGERLIKRVIGLPTEKIEVKDGLLYINGQKYDEKYEHGFTSDFNFDDLSLDNAIPENSYFVMGDNRGDSKDSRLIGFVTKDDIIGKATFAFYPFNKFGFVK